MRLSNLKARKITSGAMIQDRSHAQKHILEHIKVEEGDLLKFGRVRFRVKTLSIQKRKYTP